LLCAVPQLQDPNFARAVVLMLEHGEHGALGLVLNNLTAARLLDVAEALDLDWRGDPEEPVRLGGPVDPEVGWLLHDDPDWDPSARDVGGGLWLTTTLEPVIEQGRQSFGGSGRRHMFLLGYAGWGGHQLEAEIAAGSWVLVPVKGVTGPSVGAAADLGVDPAWLFETEPEQMWEGALRSIMVDPHRLVGLHGGFVQ
jgi:putative transcriptional regulator